jgi:hypothetical protein
MNRRFIALPTATNIIVAVNVQLTAKPALPCASESSW